MVKRWNSKLYAGQYTDFYFLRKSPSGKTKVFGVIDKYGNELGEVKWFSRWRWYIFFPTGGTHHSARCLRDIADFCDMVLKEHREKNDGI